MTKWIAFKNMTNRYFIKVKNLLFQLAAGGEKKS
jgi:hypothetical protein